MPANPTDAAKTNSSPKKTLVVGSSGHAHVAGAAWADLMSVNIMDFDAVVFDVAALDEETIGALPRYGYFNVVRKQLARFLSSGGTIIALTPERQGFHQDSDYRNNWEWCPIEIYTEPEAGDTIETTRKDFNRYLSKLKRWTFYFYVTQNALSHELTEVFGSPYDVNYRVPFEAFAVNRYRKILAGKVSLLVSSGGHNNKFGDIIVLPLIAELEQREAMNLVLEDLIGKPQQSLPPKWTSQIPMPFVADIDAEITQKNDSILALQEGIAAKERERAKIVEWRKLVYATGHELEKVFEDAMIKLGAKTKSAAAEEEFIFEHKGYAGVVECKGVGKSISLEHVRQTDSHVLKFIEAENREGKGILFGNAWRNLPLGERGKPDTPIFPDNVIKHAAQREIALVGSGDFLDAFCRFLKDEVPGEALLDAVSTQSGIVDFRAIK